MRSTYRREESDAPDHPVARSFDRSTGEASERRRRRTTTPPRNRRRSQLETQRGSRGNGSGCLAQFDGGPASGRRGARQSANARCGPTREPCQPPFAGTSSGCQTALAMTTALVLVHSPLVGPDSLEALAESLSRRGERVSVVDLTNALKTGPPYWGHEVEAIIAAITDPCILVGHSRAGPLLPLAARAARSVEGCLFVDARLPHPGASWSATTASEFAEQLRRMGRDGWLAPWPDWWGPDELARLLPDPMVRARFVRNCPRLPLALFEEVLPEMPGWPDVRCAYLRLSEEYWEPCDEARRLGWPVIELASHHLGLITDPETVTEAILELVGQLQRDGEELAE
jgi:hypothetical protein